MKLKDLTREQYRNIVNSEEAIVANAIASLPDECRDAIDNKKKELKKVEDDFLEFLTAVKNPFGEVLLKKYLKFEEIKNDYEGAREEAAFCYGLFSKHKKLRMRGWVREEVVEEDE